MRIGIRGRLFLVSLGLIAVVGGSSALYLESQLRGLLESMVIAELFRVAETAQEAVRALPAGAMDAEIDALADRLGAVGSVHVTLLERDGRVGGDSDLGPAELGRIEKLSGRPELEDALRGERGLSRRYSTVAATDLLLAVPRPDPSDRIIVRVARPLSDVDAAARGLRVMILLACAFGLGIAVVMSGLASHLMSADLRRLVGDVQRIARAGEERGGDDDEIERLAGSIHRLERDLNRTVGLLAQERDRLETVLEGMSEGVVAVDEGRRVTLANGAALALLGVPALPFGRPLVEAMRLPRLHETLERARSGLTSAELELLETGRRVLVRAAPLGAAGGVVLVMLDVTEMRRLETVRKDFVANVSHELRTPLSVIRANAETLLVGVEDPEQARAFLESQIKQADRLAKVASDLLDLSRIEAGSYPLELRPVPIAAIVEQMIASMEETARQRQITVTTEVRSERALADAEALEQVLENLLDNALKYASAGGRVVVRARASGDELTLEVADDGPGIEPHHRDRVFERFYRVDTARSRELGGTGLGLSIVRNLVESMDGRVGVRPATPRGSVFWFTLPRAPER